MNTSRRGFLKASGLISLGAVVAPAVTFNAFAQDNPAAKAPSGLSADDKVIPALFAKQSFGIDGGSRELTLLAVNTEGNKSSFNVIVANLYDYQKEQTTKWWVTGFTEPIENRDIGVILGEWSKTPTKKPLIVEEKSVVAYVEKLSEMPECQIPYLKKAAKIVGAVLE